MGMCTFMICPSKGVGLVCEQRKTSVCLDRELCSTPSHPSQGVGRRSRERWTEFLIETGCDHLSIVASPGVQFKRGGLVVEVGKEGALRGARLDCILLARVVSADGRQVVYFRGRGVRLAPVFALFCSSSGKVFWVGRARVPGAVLISSPPPRLSRRIFAHGLQAVQLVGDAKVRETSSCPSLSPFLTRVW